MSLRVVELARAELASCMWDEFAERCGVSFRCAYNALAAWQFAASRSNHYMLLRLRRFEIFSDDHGGKIGQCAIAIGRKQAVFIDRLQLLPACEAFWRPAMAGLLAAVGPGRYHYGSRWNIEPSRALDLQNLSGVTVEVIEDLVVQGIDFTYWESWDDYFRQISNNARRNAKRASMRYPTPSVRVRCGFLTLLDMLAIICLNRRTVLRKKLSPFQLSFFRFIFRIVTRHKYSVTAVASVGGRALAAFFGIEFGQNTYYETGGSRADNGGVAWHLMLAMIRRAYDRTYGSGKFIMGIKLKSGPGWDNLAWSREQCRVADFPTSIVTFVYRAARGDQSCG
jgi:hypothetical protein